MRATACEVLVGLADLSEGQYLVNDQLGFAFADHWEHFFHCSFVIECADWRSAHAEPYNGPVIGRDIR